MLNYAVSPSFIAEGSKTQGAIIFEGHAEVFGTIEGDIEQQSSEILLIGRSGWIQGSIQANGPVVIEGRIDGAVISKTKIVIASSASVFGTVQAPKVEVCAGSIVEASVQMQQKPQTPGLRLKFAA